MVKPGSTVVIVEDDFFIAEANQMACEACGLAVLDTCDGEDEAIASIVSHRPDYVLLDVRLSRHGDGVAVAKAVAERGYKGSVIFATGSKDPHTVKRLESTDPYAILFKPFGEDEILKIVARSTPSGGNDQFLEAG